MDGIGDTAAGRVLAVLEALAEANRTGRAGMTTSSLARVMDRDKSSVSRQLKPLVALGLVEKDPDGVHRLGWRLFAVAAQAGDQRLLLLAPPVMRQLSRTVGERTHLSIRRHDQVLTILTEGPQRAVEAVNWVGKTVPMTSTSTGRALMLDDSADEVRSVVALSSERSAEGESPVGDLSQVKGTLDSIQAGRSLGYVAVVDEFEEGLSAVAAPVRDVHGRIAAALNISVPSYRLGGGLPDLGRRIRHAADYVSTTLASPEAGPTYPPKDQ
ncbi:MULTISPECIES: IclR family transcriptional regulator [Prauserella salsuginis group]|uniref:DNA-binding IclR family transcriptional regulator n=2 Tax=Prauserella salsuginis group TaxID=2893672 RepID=A0A839XZQ4_9PSEU|nr:MULTISPECIES: IclR family transcriptional regulator [Prauserella salsuginis group]MBB3665516.1 DNA-binding IclR family transcriptional regulator [Prauserella sediminis]MCR3718786.1 transcriptional regulator, IclR family [Prauserella flava]MCR3733356.1 transcriptional regulator, IclR family [Prauserella salsuginis]